MAAKKMIIEMRTYLLRPGTVPAFMELIRHCYLKSATENSNKMMADFWVTSKREET